MVLFSIHSLEKYCRHPFYVGFEVLTLLIVKITIIWDVMLCSVEDKCKQLEEYAVSNKEMEIVDYSKTAVTTSLSNYTMSHPRKTTEIK
jgi:hypothetical protein